MSEKIELLIHFICTLIKLLKPGGVKVVMAETMTTRQQLIVINRGRKRAVLPQASGLPCIRLRRTPLSTVALIGPDPNPIPKCGAVRTPAHNHLS